MRTLLALILAGVLLPTEAAEKVTVDLFVAPDCPIANAYAPEFERLHLAYRDKGVSLRLVFPDRDLDEERVKAHLEEFGLTMPFVIDRDHALVRRADATTTPEAVVFDREGNVVYSGRIDDRYTDLGARRQEAKERYLSDAIEAVLLGKRPPLARTEPIGCLIERE